MPFDEDHYRRLCEEDDTEEFADPWNAPGDLTTNYEPPRPTHRPPIIAVKYDGRALGGDIDPPPICMVCMNQRTACCCLPD